MQSLGFRASAGERATGQRELMRSSKVEMYEHVEKVKTVRDTHAEEAKPRLRELQKVARERKNTFAALMEAGKVFARVNVACAL